MDHIFTHPSADGHLSCIHAIVNSALVNKGHLALLQRHPHRRVTPSRGVLSSSLPPCTLADLSPCLEYVGPRHRFCGSLSIQTVRDQWLHSLKASKSSLLSQPIAPQVGTSPCFSPPPSGYRVQSHSFSSSFSLCSSYHFCMDLYIPSREGNGTHSSTLAWKIPWMEEPGRLQSMESLRVRRD